MKLIWHIVWKDLTRLRWWLVLWIVALALPILDGVELILRCPFPLPYGVWTRPTTHGAMVVVEILVGYLIATLLWHEDRVAGTRQFWTTRPISGGRLFSAKVLGAVVVLWLIPVLVSLPWWLWCGFNLHQVALASFEAAQLAAVLGIPVAMVAAITDTLVRSLIWTAVLIVTAVPLFFTTLQGTQDVPLLGSRVLLIVALLLSEMLLLTVVRFVFRLWRWPIAVIGVTMVASVFLARSARYVWFDRPGVWKPERAAAVQVDFDGSMLKVMGPKDAREHPSNDTQVIVDAQFRVSAPATASGVVPIWAAQKWIRPGGDDLMYPAGFRLVQAPIIEGLHPVLGDSRTLPYAPDASAMAPAIETRTTNVYVFTPIRYGLLQQIRRESAAYEARLMFAQMRLRIANECPIERGRWHAHDGYGLRIESVRWNDDRAAILLVNTQPAPMADMLLRWGWRGWLRGSFNGNLALVNREAGEYVWVRGPSPRTLRVNGVEVSWATQSVAVGHLKQGNDWVPRPGWFEHANLAVISTNTESIFTRDVSVPKFVIGPIPGER